MDIYSLTRKKRPSQLTIAQPSPLSHSDSDSALNGSVPKKPLSNQMSEEITGPPTRDHWKSDSEVNNCESIGCSINFGLFDRRHHCRKCGDIFCSAHCSNYFRLDQDAQFHLHGILSRGCNSCAEEYKRWQEGLRHPKSGGKKNEENKNNSNNKLSLRKRHAGIMTHQPQAMEGVTELGRDDIVSKGVNINNKSAKKDQAFNPIPSVPADWQWSTF
ncbi:hypothetical protein G6F46_008552 [Rhizopus delemar]|uniref:FYVE-type domain-containing protein n=3 Tax=Rhizopus TaxID=4842 RepID=A0A9P6YYS8_9FUNG|nr:hypothetical protein G6F55_007519 [Rhizopus delemar]KAG1539898.1 hypothetical protein G6F51_008854 [Rhizopus arrhizus]KAG1494138.1 hypothetical protein G6F54_008087 [Rhizopus delemar]KAG1508265.1 hypothetical protein G6F53_008326 [Rhizopus delemar]KAG1527440.1 hypothetical protein G6F52_001529 [Rhizopus delemar]